jgi:hypothetical protein
MSSRATAIEILSTFPGTIRIGRSLSTPCIRSAPQLSRGSPTQESFAHPVLGLSTPRSTTKLRGPGLEDIYLLFRAAFLCSTTFDGGSDAIGTVEDNLPLRLVFILYRCCSNSHETEQHRWRFAHCSGFDQRIRTLLIHS